MSEEFRTLKCEVITPVHIGSGVEFDRWSYITEGLRIKYIDINELLERFSDNQYLLEHFATDTHRGLTELCSKAGIKLAELPVLYTVQATSTSGITDIRGFIKTSGIPYIPGSSVKGAIRTAILWHLIKQKGMSFKKDFLRSINDRKARKRLIDNLFHRYARHGGADAQKDFMRVLHTADIRFSLNDLTVHPTRVLNLTGRKLSYKHQGSRPMTIHCEYIAAKRKSDSSLRIKVDRWLLKNNFTGAEDIIDNYPSICNRFYRSLAEEELEFFKDYKNQPMQRFYERLLSEMDASGDGSIYLHLGWGSGWRSMTGNWMDVDVLQKIRRIEKLGKKDFDIFPKTRKAVFFSDINLLPPGWIKLVEVR